MKYPFLPVFAFLSAILVLIPFPWHWRARNIATMSIMAWLSVVNIIYGVNAIVWAGNVDNPIPVWCDITSKIVVGASYALPLATLCICKHLEMVSSSRKVSYDIKDRQRRMIFESIMCFGVPIIFMALHYVVQGHRFDIIENFGCQATVYISVQAILIIWFPQLLFAVITLIFAALALHNFVRRRLMFAAHLQNSNSGLTTNRYLRLIAMAMTEMIWGVVLTAYNLWSNASPGLRPWTNWADVHSNFSRVDTFPVDEVPGFFIQSMLFFWWTLPASSLIFFIFFGFGEDAMKEYRKLWNLFRKKILRKPEIEKKKLFDGSLPSFSRGLRPLQILKLRTTSSDASSPTSYEFTARSPQSPQSHLSQSTITLAASPDACGHKKLMSDESHKYAESLYSREVAPPYYPPTPQYLHPTVPSVTIGASIDPSRGAEHILEPQRTSEPLRESDTFTISAFSYYGSSDCASPSTLAPPASPGYSVPTQLSPPPRHFPRHWPSAPTMLSRSDTPVPASGLHSGVPDEIEPSRPISCVVSSSSRIAFNTYDITQQEPKLLGVPWGSVQVTKNVEQHVSMQPPPKP